MDSKIVYVILQISMIACQPKVDKEAVKKEIALAEEAFNEHAQIHGLKSAFVSFAHSEAVINRGDSIIRGIKGIENYFDNQSYLEAQLSWKPDFIDVASSGDLGYTYGKYHFKGMRLDSTRFEVSGIFHSVWKKDENGQWKFVYD